MNLMAKSCFSPGLIALVANLITSSNDYNDEAAAESADGSTNDDGDAADADVDDADDGAYD